MSYDGWLTTNDQDTERDWDGTRDERRQEREDDELYQADYATVEAIFRSRLESRSLPEVLTQVGRVVSKPDDALSHDMFLVDALQQWGPSMVLRALARATEPTRLTPLVDVVEHE